MVAQAQRILIAVLVAISFLTRGEWGAAAIGEEAGGWSMQSVGRQGWGGGRERRCMGGLRGGKGIRLSKRIVVGKPYTNTKNKPAPRNKKNLSVVQQANAKITTHIHRRLMRVAVERASAAGEKLTIAMNDMKASKESLRLNLKDSSDSRLARRIRSMAGQHIRKGGFVGKSKRK